jgi:hypothetical protein
MTIEIPAKELFMSTPSNFIPPAAAAGVFPPKDEDVTKLPGEDETLDEGETNDSQATVEQDIREADDSSDKLDE